MLFRYSQLWGGRCASARRNMIHVDSTTDRPAPMPTALIGLAVVAMGVVFAALLFVPAGRLNWAFGWIYVGLLVTWVTIN